MPKNTHRPKNSIKIKNKVIIVMSLTFDLFFHFFAVNSFDYIFRVFTSIKKYLFLKKFLINFIDLIFFAFNNLSILSIKLNEFFSK